MSDLPFTTPSASVIHGSRAPFVLRLRFVAYEIRRSRVIDGTFRRQFLQRGQQRWTVIVNGLGPTLTEQKSTDGRSDCVLSADMKLVQLYSVDAPVAGLLDDFDAHITV